MVILASSQDSSTCKAPPHQRMSLDGSLASAIICPTKPPRVQSLSVVQPLDQSATNKPPQSW